MAWWGILILIIAGLLFVFLTALIVTVKIIINKSFKNTKKKKDIDAQARAELNARFGADPAWFDDKIQKLWRIESFDDLSLAAVFIQNPAALNKIAIVQHGFKCDAYSVQAQAKIFYESGYSLLLPFARAHGQSQGRYIGMGWLDRFDLRRWLDAVKDKLGENIETVVMGISMGATAACALPAMNLPSNVRAIICDGPFSSLKEQYAHKAQNSKIPFRILMPLLNLGCRLFMGYSFYDADFTQFVKKARVPMLFIHGRKDEVVSPECSQKLYDACTSPNKKIEIFDEAKHCNGVVTDYPRYKSIIEEFIRS